MDSIQGQIINKHLDIFNESIRFDLSAKGIDNSGEASRSLRVENNGNSYKSIGSDYIEVLDKGRGPGKFAPVNDMQSWVKTKLKISESPLLERVAYAVNLKIKEEGTQIFIDNSKGLEIDKKIIELRNNLMAELRVFAVVDVKKSLNKFLLNRTI